MTKRLIDLLCANYEARRRRVVIMGVEVFVSPLTVGESAKVAAMHPDDSALRTAESIILATRDAEGKPVFTIDDKQRLKRAVAGDDLTPILNAMYGPAEAEIAKNSEGDDQ